MIMINFKIHFIGGTSVFHAIYEFNVWYINGANKLIIEIDLSISLSRIMYKIKRKN